MIQEEQAVQVDVRAEEMTNVCEPRDVVRECNPCGSARGRQKVIHIWNHVLAAELSPTSS
jgi:hypothetical protein